MNYTNTEKINKKGRSNSSLFTYVSRFLFLYVISLFLIANYPSFFTISAVPAAIKAPRDEHVSGFTLTFNHVKQDVDSSKKWTEEIYSASVREEISNIFVTRKTGKKSKIDFFKRDCESSKTNLYLEKNIILYGPPGTGKSHSAFLIAKNIGSYYVLIIPSSLGDGYIGTASRRWTKVVDLCREKANAEKLKNPHAKPVVIIVDEIDSLIKRRGNGDDKSDRNYWNDLTNSFIESVDSIKRNNDNILIIGTTNFIKLVDEAAVRDGRFRRIEYPRPKNHDECKTLLNCVRTEIEKKYLIKNENIQMNEENRGQNKYFVINSSYWKDLENKMTLKIGSEDENGKRSVSYASLKNVIENDLNKLANEDCTELLFSSWK